MKQYKDFKPTAFDNHISFYDDRESWFVVPVGRTRDSGCLANCNFEVAVERLGTEENEDMEIHRFGHWGYGWFEMIIVKGDTPTFHIAEEIEAALADYPVLDDSRFSAMEHDEANKVWASCYDEKDRIKYIRENRKQFEFRDYKDMVFCVRGEHFAGYPSELLS